MENIDVMSPSQMDESMEDATSNDVMRKKMLNLLSELNSLCRAYLDVDNEEEMKQKLQSLQVSFVTFFLRHSERQRKTALVILAGSLMRLFTLCKCVGFRKSSSFERPKKIDVPLRDSISSIQENLKRTRMGYRRKRIISEVGERSAPRPPFKRPPPMLLSHFKQ
jgi:hypothetical protein